MSPLSELGRPAASTWLRRWDIGPAATPAPARRLRVCVFGPLRIERDGLPVVDGAKAQRRPRALLALLAAEGGRALDMVTVIDELWPSLDAEAPRASLSMAVSRLRRLLGDPGAVVCADGCLRLDPLRVWTDVAAFEALLQAAPIDGEHAPWEAIALYGDDLLGRAPVGPRLLARRQQLAQRLAELALETAGQLQACGGWDRAARLLQRTIERLPLCEPLYRQLMQAQLALGENAEALRSFQRCSDLLRAALGAAPSADTAALAGRALGHARLPQECGGAWPA